MNLAQMTTFLGISFQRLDDVCLAGGVVLILLGVWLRNQLGEVQMLAEEDIKIRRLTPEGARRRVRNRTLMVNLILVAGIVLSLSSLLILVVQSELSFMVAE